MTGPPPDRALVVTHPPKPGMPVRRIHLACAELILPTVPSGAYFFIAIDSGRARLLKLNISFLPAALAASIISWTSAALSAGGFSEKTCLPALRHWMASGL